MNAFLSRALFTLGFGIGTVIQFFVLLPTNFQLFMVQRQLDACERRHAKFLNYPCVGENDEDSPRVMSHPAI